MNLFNKKIAKHSLEPYCVIVTGDRGVGKSTLFALIVEAAKKEGLDVFCQFPYKDCYQIPLSADVINACWGKGRTEIKVLRSIKNLGAYVCKYLTKEEFDLYHKHSYHLSRGLKKPEVLTTDGYIGQWRDMYSNIHENTKVIYSNATEFVYAGADGSMQTNTILYEQGIFK